MRVTRLLCLASLLALVVFSGTGELGALADVGGGVEPPATAEAEACAEDETRQDSAGIMITMVGSGEDAEAYEHDSAGIRVTMTGQTEDDRG